MSGPWSRNAGAIREICAFASSVASDSDVQWTRWHFAGVPRYGSCLHSAGVTVNVFSLCNEPSIDVPAGITLWNAHNSPSNFVAKVASVALRGVSADDRVLAMHVNVAVTAMPLVWHGAKLSVFLHGIEAWKPLRFRERFALNAASTVLSNSDQYGAALSRGQSPIPRSSRCCMSSRNRALGWSGGRPPA